MQIVPVRRTTISPSRTTGRSPMRPMENRDLRVVDDRRRKQPADLPALVTVNVEPGGALGAARPPARAPPAPPARRGSRRRSWRRSPHDRHDEPLRRLHRHADVVALEVDDRVLLEPGVELRRFSSSAHALTTAASRSRSTDPKSHSSTQVTGGTSRCARAMCSAITRRTPRSSLRPSAAAPPEAAARTSSSVMRPCGRLPPGCRVDTEPWATLRTSGVARARSGGAAAGGSPAPVGGAAPSPPMDEHGADGHDLPFAHVNARDYAGRRGGESRRSPCRSGSRPADRPRRSPGPPPRATARPRPR